MKKYGQLFWTFFKIGLFTFGGGYAMIPLISRETVETHHWVTEEEILDMLAIAESTPGVMAVNSATFVGYRVGKFWGAFFATLGVSIPSFFIIVVLSYFIVQFRENKWISYALTGIKAGVLVLMINAIFKLFHLCPKKAFHLLLLTLSFLLATFLNINVIWLLLFSAILSVLYERFVVKSIGGDGRG